MFHTTNRYPLDKTSVFVYNKVREYNSIVYYYLRNLQGDVIAIYDASGEKKVEYAYDTWGNCTIVYAEDLGFANANPIRYRGYYFDRETGLYYLNARYYSPEWRRFISPDASEYIDPETPNGLNLYTYCNNDPVNLVDPSGHFPWLALLIVTGVLIAGGATFGGITAYQSGGDVGVGILEGAFAGLMLSGSIWLMVGSFYVPNGFTSNLGLAMFTYGFNTMAGMVEAGATQIRYSLKHRESGVSQLTKSLAANAPLIYTTKAISKTLPLATKFGLKIGEKYSYTIPGEGGVFHSYRSVGEAWSVCKSYYTQKPTGLSYFAAAGVAILSMCRIYKAIWGTPNYEDWILF